MSWPEVWSWLLIGFALVGAITVVAATRPLARRRRQVPPPGDTGADRLVGRVATVLDPISADHRVGLVQVDREQWRAETRDGSAVPVGARVRVVEVHDARVVVDTLQPADPPSIRRPP